MENIIKSVVECDSWYGVAALAVMLLGFIVLSIIAFKTIQLVLPYLYKIISKLCSTIQKYKDVHAKANVRDVVEFETDLHSD